MVLLNLQATSLIDRRERKRVLRSCDRSEVWGRQGCLDYFSIVRRLSVNWRTDSCNCSITAGWKSAWPASREFLEKRNGQWRSRWTFLSINRRPQDITDTRYFFEFFFFLFKVARNYLTKDEEWIRLLYMLFSTMKIPFCFIFSHRSINFN